MPANPRYARALAEAARRRTKTNAQVDAFAVLGYEPNCLPRLAAIDRGDAVIPEPCGECPQEQFHAATEYDVLYGGAAGGGKTKALLMDAIRACVRHPGLRVGAFRRTYDELRESLLKELALAGFAEALGAKWNGTERELTFPNRSVIRFRYLETVMDATRRQGGEYQMVILDERGLIPPDAVNIIIDERIRSGSDDIPVLGIRSGTNPGGIGHAELKTRYVDGTEHGTKVYTDDQGRTVRFIQAKVDDNPKVDRGYKKRLEGIKDPQRRRAMLDGDWDVFAGQVFSEWRRERHIVPRFDIPAEWWHAEGIDYGYAAPWAVIFGALDNDRRMWIYNELYERGVGEKDQARLILDLERRKPARRLADPSMWGKRGDAQPIAKIYAEEGCKLTPAENDRISGWQRVHTYLADGPACQHHRDLGWETCPMLHVLDGTAPNLVRTLPALPYDDRKIEDVDTDAEDHAPDALRYLLMGVKKQIDPHAAGEAMRLNALDLHTPRERIG